MLVLTVLLVLGSNGVAQEVEFIDEPLEEEIPLSERAPRQVLETLGGSLGISNLAVGIVEIFKRNVKGSSACTGFSECATNCDHDVECTQKCEADNKCSPLMVQLAGGSYQQNLHKSVSFDCFNFASCAQFCFEPCSTGASSTEAQQSEVKDLCSIDAKCLNRCNKMNRCSKHFTVSNELKMVSAGPGANVEMPQPPVSAVPMPFPNPLVPIMTLPIPLPVIDGSNPNDSNQISCNRYCGSSCRRQCKQRSRMYQVSPTRSPWPQMESYNCFMGCLNLCAQTYCQGH